MSNKVEKRGLMPRLRFPEFQEVGEWDAIPLSQLAKRSTESGKGSRDNSRSRERETR